MSELNKDDIVRDEIFRAAERMFQKWGLNKTTMEDIANEAKKGKSTLYYYFKSKEEIFDTVVTIKLGEAFSKAMELTHDVTSAKEKLKKYIISSLNELKDYTSVYTIVRMEVKRNQKFIDKIRNQFNPKEEAFIREILKLGVQSKEFTFIDEDELNTAAKAIVGIIHALELYLLLENDDSAQIDVAAKFIANGI